MRWLSRLLRRRTLERQLDAELRFHLDEHVRELIAAGRSPAQARREARRALGGIEQAKEQVRDARGTRWLEDAWQDARFALRRLRHEPGFTAVAVLTLGLGIGAATAIFSAVNPVLFEPLAYPDPGRLMTITDRSPDGAPVPVTFGSYREVVQRSRSFEALSVFRPWQPTVTGDGEPERLEGQRVSTGFFQTLGVAPALGAGFDPAHDRVGGAAVVILSDGLWRRRFAGDPGIVGREIHLDGHLYAVVGVMPRGFESLPTHPAQAWSTLQYDASLPSFEGREWGHHLGMVGRLRAGVELESARRELDAVAANPVPEYARPRWAAMGEGLSVRPLKETVTAGVRPVLLALLGAVLLLLLIACVNVTNLLLARAARRRGELAMRAALGAPRGRLVRQLLTESLLLAGLGGALGIAVARMGIGTLIALAPPGLPRADAIAMDPTALAFAVGLTTLIGVLVGLTPALGVERADLHGEARRASRRTGGADLATRRALVIAEVELAVVLLVGAGLLVRSLQQLFAADPGFDPDRVLVMQVQTAGSRFADEDALRLFFDRALQDVRQLPGVVSAAWTSQLPLSGDLDAYGVKLENEERPGTERVVYRYAVTPGYLDTMGIRLLRGRSLDERDVAGAPGAVLVSESFARRAFVDRDAIGQRVHVGRTDLPPYTIVGVVGDVKQASLAVEPADGVYVAPEQWYFADRALWLVTRVDGDAATLVGAIRKAIWAVDADQPIVRLQTMDALVDRSEARRRFALVVLQAFALLALGLAGIGLYGLLSGSVAERRREIGVRAALGATRESIVKLVVGQGLALTGLGMAIGVAASTVATGALATLLFGVSRLDPLTYGAVAVVLAATAILACWVPATRASRVDPVTTLRAE